MQYILSSVHSQIFKHSPIVNINLSEHKQYKEHDLHGCSYLVMKRYWHLLKIWGKAIPLQTWTGP
jgi:hypothetical protein